MSDDAYMEIFHSEVTFDKIKHKISLQTNKQKNIFNVLTFDLIL